MSSMDVILDNHQQEKKKNESKSTPTDPALIIENLLLGSAFSALSDSIREEHNIKYIVNMAREIPCKFENDGVEYLHVEIDDMATENIQENFEKVNKFVTDRRKKGVVLVHCQAGISRSATAVLSYLMATQGMSLRDAHTLVKKARPYIEPNYGFWERLCEFECDLGQLEESSYPPQEYGRSMLLNTGFSEESVDEAIEKCMQDNGEFNVNAIMMLLVEAMQNQWNE